MFLDLLYACGSFNAFKYRSSRSSPSIFYYDIQNPSLDLLSGKSLASDNRVIAFFDLLDHMEIPSWSVILLGASGLYILSLIITAIYNIWFHLLAGLPGPKIAVIGPWYEFYYDVIKDGRYP